MRNSHGYEAQATSFYLALAYTSIFKSFSSQYHLFTKRLQSTRYSSFCPVRDLTHSLGWHFNTKSTRLLNWAITESTRHQAVHNISSLDDFVWWLTGFGVPPKLKTFPGHVLPLKTSEIATIDCNCEEMYISGQGISAGKPTLWQFLW